MKAFTAAIRNRIFIFLWGLVVADFKQAITNLNSPPDPDGQPWTVARLKQSMEACLVEPDYLYLDPNARNVLHTYVTPAEEKKSWWVGATDAG